MTGPSRIHACSTELHAGQQRDAGDAVVGGPERVTGSVQLPKFRDVLGETKHKSASAKRQVQKKLMDRSQPLFSLFSSFQHRFNIDDDDKLSSIAFLIVKMHT